MDEVAVFEDNNYPHVVVCPSAGMGHLIPFLRLASMLSSSNCNVTLITIQPTLSSAESTQISTFLSTHPHINSLEIPLHFQPPPQNTAAATTASKGGPDPFFLRYDAVSRSAYLITQHLSALTPPPSAVFSDIMFVSGFAQALVDLGIPNYVLVTTSARFFAATCHLPQVGLGIDAQGSLDEQVVEFPVGLAPIPKSSIPPPFFNPNHIFTKMLSSNCSCLGKVDGIILNTFTSFEPDTISALRDRDKPILDLPMIYPIGPLRPMGNIIHNQTKADADADGYLRWLDAQPANSVMYISFGSRTAMSGDQILELADGVEQSGVQFLWVVKTTTVDKDEKDDADLVELLGRGFLERTKERGLVLIKEWVNQDMVLDHPAVGGFMTHCGWNSVMEAAQRGMPLLAWPQHGDQKVNAGVVEKAGLGVWDKGWGWAGQRLVMAHEIAHKVRLVMMSDELRMSAKKVGEDASMVWDTNDIIGGGSSADTLNKIISTINNNI